MNATTTAALAIAGALFLWAFGAYYIGGRWPAPGKDDEGDDD